MFSKILLTGLLMFSPLKANELPSEEIGDTLSTITYSSADGYTLIINEEDKTFTLESENESYKGTYTINELGEYELYVNNEFRYRVEVNNEDNTFTIFKEISEEDAEKEVIDTITAWLDNYLNTDLIGQIINWAIDVGLISIIAGIYFKYRKYKAKSSEEIASEVENKIKEVLGNEFSKLSKEQIDTILSKIDNFDDALKVFEQALVLAQDKTSEGKKALLEIITKNTKSEETKKVAEKVEEKVIEEQKKTEEIKNKVKNNYTPID